MWNRTLPTRDGGRNQDDVATNIRNAAGARLGAPASGLRVHGWPDANADSRADEDPNACPLRDLADRPQPSRDTIPSKPVGGGKRALAQ